MSASAKFTKMFESSGPEHQGPSHSLREILSTIPFWCGDAEKHLKNREYWYDLCCSWHMAGMPVHPATREEMPPTPYQLETAELILNNHRPKKGETEKEALQRPNLYHHNKGRQMGITELYIRIMFHCSFGYYAGQNVGIQAGTTGTLARKNLRRLARLYLHIPEMVSSWKPGKNDTYGKIKGNTLELINGTTFESFPASEEAITGDTKYAAVLADEMAKWRLIDDEPVFNSLLPIIRTNGADFFGVSTPKGPIKMFYKIHKDPNDFVKITQDIWRTEGNLYTKKHIESILETSAEDPNQEYLCKFVLGEDSILGIISDEDKEEGLTEWLTDDEDDSYDESGQPDPDDEWG